MLPNKRNPKESGKVITFYSYKGGVGRSFILANVASQLALWGFRVLCVDWDLEAPGLTEYFLEEIGDNLFENSDGIVDLMLEYQKTGTSTPNWKRTIVEIPLIHRTIQGVESALHLISAGRGAPNSQYIDNVHQLDWDALYSENDFANKLDDLKQAWQENYDVVFLDSRTGISDVSGICTVQLPDVLALVLTPNKQSLEGIFQIANRAVQNHAQFPLSEEKLLTIPIVSRLDQRDETIIAESWLARINKILAPLYDSWLSKEVSVQRIQDFTKVPYVTRWSYGETLAVLLERGTDPEQISHSFQSLAALLIGGMEQSAEFARNRDEFISKVAKREKATHEIAVIDPLARRLLESRSASAIAAYAEVLQEEQNLDDANALWNRAINLSPNEPKIFKGYIGFLKKSIRILNKNPIDRHLELQQLKKTLMEAERTLKTFEPEVSRIYSDNLPTSEGNFFGRKTEIKILNEAIAGNDTNIIQFISSGGVGKTKLLRYWLDSIEIKSLIAWSFYSQGLSEDKQVSATPFFTHVFKVLQSDKTTFNTEEEKGKHLAHLLRQRRCLLVLDGLEPLQHIGRGMRGELKDRAIR